MKTYAEDEFLQLSGLQHFKFCERQWALIHVEKQWADNFHTTDGKFMHKNAHDNSYRESRIEKIVTRGANIFSPTLGVSGQCDVLEYHRGTVGIKITGKDGLWLPFPVEYKRGKPREDGADELQLCAQAMCLEEMLCCEIPKGALFYGETRHRKEVVFTPEIRKEVERNLEAMHLLFDRGYTPKANPAKSCDACSLKELCLPELMKIDSVNVYISKAIEEP